MRFFCTTCAEYANPDVIKFIENLQNENERLKGELKQTEVQDQVVIDTLRNENERLKGELEKDVTRKILSEHCNSLQSEIKILEKRNDRLRCLALHLFSKYFFDCYWNSEGPDSIRYLHLSQKYGEAYRKTKKELGYGKID